MLVNFCHWAGWQTGVIYQTEMRPMVRLDIRWKVLDVKTREQRSKMEILLKARLTVVAMRATRRCWLGSVDADRAQAT